MERHRIIYVPIPSRPGNQGTRCRIEISAYDIHGRLRALWSRFCGTGFCHATMEHSCFPYVLVYPNCWTLVSDYKSL